MVQRVSRGRGRENDTPYILPLLCTENPYGYCMLNLGYSGSLGLLSQQHCENSQVSVVVFCQ